MSGEGDPNTQTSTETDQDESTKCLRCQVKFGTSILQVFVSGVNIEDLLQKGNNSVLKHKEEFQKLFCALLNCLEGNAVIFHVKNARILDSYDSKLNDTLMQLVPDNSCYHDVFERVILDKQHFRVRVKPRKDSECVMSTFRFHSSLSLDKGLDNHPSHHNMQRVLENARDGHGYCNEMLFNLPDDTSFEFNKEVQVVGCPEGRVPFQECMWLQAKQIKPLLEPTCLVDMMWGPKEDNKHDLGKYISAFSKVPGGGIIYFGIRETDTDKDMLKRFYSEGVVLDQKNYDTFQHSLEIRMKNLLWVRAPSKSDTDQSKNSTLFAGSVDVFRLSGGHQRRCIIKITVSQFQGVCFFRKEGPESYELNDEDKPVPVQDWAHWAAGSHCEDLVPVDVQFHWKMH